MSRLDRNQSIVSCIVAGLDIDREVANDFIKDILDRGEEKIEFKKLKSKSKVWNLQPLDRKYWAKGGSIMRKMTVGSFLKKYSTGKYFLMLDKEMIYIKNGLVAVGDVGMKSKINHGLKIK